MKFSYKLMTIPFPNKKISVYVLIIAKSAAVRNRQKKPGVQKLHTGLKLPKNQANRAVCLIFDYCTAETVEIA